MAPAKTPIEEARELWAQHAKPGVISRATGISPRTLHRYIKAFKFGYMPKLERGPQPTLSIELERDIVSWIIGMQQSGMPVTRRFVLVKVGIICSVLGLPPLTEGWYERFLGRHPVLATRHAQVISRARNSPTEQDMINVFNTMLGYVVQEHLDASRIFNMDESGFLSHSKSKKVVAAKGSPNVWAQTMATSFHLTYVACVSAAGYVVPPLFILPGVRVDEAIATAMTVPGSKITCTESGFINARVMHLWLDMLATSVPDSIKRPLLLTLDGYGGHFSSEIVTKAYELQIIMLCLPPNATHLVQPLDVAVFGPLKKHIAKTILDYMVETNTCSLTKAQAIQLASKSWQAITQENAINGFRACGLFPLNKPRMLARLAHFQEGGVKPPEGYSTDWLQHKNEIREEVLTLPPLPMKAVRKRKTVDA
ncbi:hypothetical protein ACHHYP_16173 [Achlya hypogyna]|uniref:HTH CENPB-type domain-containing protein n=1 Tax=Achlya hypogyna TaxID=1202772 RepID=A0A1V9Y9F1_ACHHY|nr:hypothetical protein ACHHYP_16173 [Achlya hypogyna]